MASKPACYSCIYYATIRLLGRKPIKWCALGEMMIKGKINYCPVRTPLKIK